MEQNNQGIFSIDISTAEPNHISTIAYGFTLFKRIFSKEIREPLIAR